MMPFLKINAVLLLVSLLTTKASAQEEPWHNCKSDDDCILVPGTCREPISINKKFKEEYLEHAEKTANIVLCQNIADGQWRSDPKYFIPKCENSKCIRVPQPHLKKSDTP